MATKQFILDEFLPTSALGLGWLVESLENPSMDAFQPKKPLAADAVMRIAGQDFDTLASTARKYPFRLSLTQILSSEASFRNEDNVQLKSAELSHCSLRQPRALFKEMLRDGDARAWMEECVQAARKFYVVVELYTAKDPKLSKGHSKAHTTDVDLSLPIDALALGGADVLGLGDQLDSGPAFYHSKSKDFKKDFALNGSYICAIGFKRIVWNKMTFRKSLDDAKLDDEVTWSFLGGKCGSNDQNLSSVSLDDQVRGPVRVLSGSLDKASHSRAEIAEELASYATKQREQYNVTGDPLHLRKAIKSLEEAIGRTGQKRATGLVKYGDFPKEFVEDLRRSHYLVLRSLFLATGDIGFLDRCIDAARSIVSAPQNSSHIYVFRAACFLSRSISYRYFAQHEKNENDARAAVEVARQALSAYQKVRKEMRVGVELRLAVEDATELVNGPLGISKAQYLDGRATAHKHRFVTSGDLEALRAARSHFTAALKLLPPTHRNYPAYAVNCADCEVSFIRKTEDVDGLEPALKLINDLDFGRCSPDERVQATYTRSLLYRVRFDLFSNCKDIDDSVAAAEEAVELIANRQSPKLSALENLSTQLCCRAQVWRSIEDIDAAIEASISALNLARNDSKDRFSLYAALGAGLETKYSLFGGPENLSAAIDAFRRAVDDSLEIFPHRGRLLHTLANGLRRIFEDSWRFDLLDESIQVELEALKLVSEDDPIRCDMLCGLALSLELRFQKTGSEEDLDESISVLEEVLARAKSGSAFYADYHHRLAKVMLVRFSLSKQAQDADRALRSLSKAVSSHVGDERRLLFLTTLSSCLLSRKAVSDESSEIECAIETLRRSIEKNLFSHPSRPYWLSELGILLYCTSERSLGIELKRKYLQEALRTQKESVATLPRDHPDTAWFLFFLGSLQVKLYEILSGDLEHQKQILSAAISSFRQGFDHGSAGLLIKIHNGMRAGFCYMLSADWKPASDILSKSVLLSRQLGCQSSDGASRQRKLHELTGMSTDACISYMMSGNMEAAVEILEAGRGIISDVATRHQNQLLALRNASPNLYTRYVGLRQRLSLLSSSVERCQNLDLVARRNRDQAKTQATENEIRRLPGLDDFNRNMSASQIKQLANHGPLVSFCATEHGAFALIVTTKTIESVALPELAWADVEENIPLVIGEGRLSVWPPSRRAKANKKMKGLLAWLWRAAVRPVLRQLKLLRKETPSLPPRLWWITNGPLGLMPLHAAGEGSKFPFENTYAHVVSSYAATFASLKFARECQSKVSERPPKAALVSMPKTSGKTDLDTFGDAEALREAFSGSITNQKNTRVVELRQPSAAEVLHHVQRGDADIVHFSCHAEPDLTDPSRTALLFGRDPAAASADPLSIQELMKSNGATNIPSRAPQLAYLSACCTAQQYQLPLLDENINLATAFQAVGFPAVVGTFGRPTTSQPPSSRRLSTKKRFKSTIPNQNLSPK
ncbi:CHAT domain-containing protein [Phyllosticta capitalensis]